MIAAPVQALCQPIPKPSALRESSLELRRNDDLDPEAVVEWLVDEQLRAGRCDRSAGPVRPSRRHYRHLCPVGQRGSRRRRTRLQIRNPQSAIRNQRPCASSSSATRSRAFARSTSTRSGPRTRSRASASWPPRRTAVIEQRELFTNILPEDAIVVFEEPAEVEEVANVFLARIENADRLYSWPEIYDSACQVRAIAHLSLRRRSAGGMS